MLSRELVEEASRQLTICNACRYCEGYCPVFQAIELKRDFVNGDVVFMAHLCHDCRACYYACMYSPPHEFAINVPQVLSQIRVESYQDWSWPSWLGRSFTDRRVGNAVSAIAVGIVIILSLVLIGPSRLFTAHRGPGAFYAVIPFFAMVVPAFALVFYGIAIWIAGGARFWREAGSVLGNGKGLRALATAAGDALRLKGLKGGGPGCYYPGAKPSFGRRLYHSLVFYGFMSALASTILAAFYQDVLHRLPPYSLTSAPVIFGSLGGVAMIVGICGLIFIKWKSDPKPAGTDAPKLDYSFLIILGLSSLSGMLTLALRSTSAMGSALVIHLALIAALFVTAPYGKFVHALYRSLALIMYRLAQTCSGLDISPSSSDKE
jgi:citrate/tricarballylate utilization protein